MVSSPICERAIVSASASIWRYFAIDGSFGDASAAAQMGLGFDRIAGGQLGEAQLARRPGRARQLVRFLEVGEGGARRSRPAQLVALRDQRLDFSRVRARRRGFGDDRDRDPDRHQCSPQHARDDRDRRRRVSSSRHDRNAVGGPFGRRLPCPCVGAPCPRAPAAPVGAAPRRGAWRPAPRDGLRAARGARGGVGTGAAAGAARGAAGASGCDDLRRRRRALGRRDTTHPAAASPSALPTTSRPERPTRRAGRFRDRLRRGRRRPRRATQSGRPPTAACRLRWGQRR